MSSSRDNHYVPQWYQKGFFEPGRNKFVYLDLTPTVHRRPDGSIVPGRSTFENPTSRCFFQTDLYSTFFRAASGTAVNDEIERRLFGSIDASGARAVRAFAGADPREWHRHFADLFTYIDVQKLRTPKGLDWLRSRYPKLSQNELMWEMQGLQTLHCTIWTEGVREIVSAEDAGVKFIISDHPVTIFNPALPPGALASAYPNDPDIALKGSQTIFPLNRDFCLILTNLENARDPAANPLEKRTFARNFRASMARTDAFIRTRKLTGAEVTRINAAIKAGARRYLAAGKEAWLHPDGPGGPNWAEIAETLRPPKDGLWSFGGEMYAKFDDGQVMYQDAFGRREAEHLADFQREAASPSPKGRCGCGAPRRFRDCCQPIPAHLRPSWTEVSMHERNIGLLRAAIDIFGLSPEKTWTDVRREMTDEKIRSIYEVFAGLWPLETDLLRLLPKPDGRPRAVYSGLLHPESVIDIAVGAGLYFGETIIQHPFMHPRIMAKEYSPLENPQSYRSEILKTLLCFLTLSPLVEMGLIHLTPDPGSFDPHLQRTVMAMARRRAEGLDIKPEKSDRAFALMQEAGQRAMMEIPEFARRTQVERVLPHLDEKEVLGVLAAVDRQKERDPLAVLQSDPLPEGEAGGQFMMMSLAPNFEMAMYLAQATGSCLITDSKPRFKELLQAVLRRGDPPDGGLSTLVGPLKRTLLHFPQDPADVIRLAGDNILADYPATFGAVTRYLRGLEDRGRRPNFEAQLPRRFALAQMAQDRLAKSGARVTEARVHALLPERGLQDNTVNRLLLMSSSEHHWPSVPAAYFLEPALPR